MGAAVGVGAGEGGAECAPPEQSGPSLIHPRTSPRSAMVAMIRRNACNGCNGLQWLR